MKRRKPTSKDLKRIQSYRIIDDMFMNLFFDEDNDVTAFVLRIILKMPDLKVTSTKVQRIIENPNGRSIKLDVHAIDSHGKQYDIEMQRDSEDAHPKRARYYSSLMDTKMLKPQQRIKDLKDTYVIFITEEDVFHEDKPIYRFETLNVDNYEQFNDGRHIIYLNASYDDDATDLGKLVHDMMCRQPDEMKYKVLADKAKYLKDDKEVVDKMLSASEQIREEGIKRGRAQGKAEADIEFAMKLLIRGKDTYEEIAEITGLPIKKIEKLAKKKAV